jgi:exodeoxyribonuclease VII large subunit
MSAERREAAALPTLGVRDALALAAGALSEALPGELWVTGEVASLTRSRAGHLYLTLAEDGARLTGAVLGRDVFRVMAKLRGAGIELAAGMALRCRGQLTLYAGRGEVQLRIVDVDPRVSIGAHELARRATRARLAEEGLDRAQARRQLAGPPHRAGVVAPDGAGLGDLATLVAASPWAIELRVVQAPAEGPDAPAKIAAAIGAAAAGADLVILARGGGAAITAPYDTEAVARAVATAPVPVVTALGHAQDRSLADELAWRSVPTPTAAAHLLGDLFTDADRQLVAAGRDIAATIRVRLHALEDDLEHLAGAFGDRLVAARASTRASTLASTSGDQHWRRVALVAVVVAVALLALLVAVVLR